MKRNNEERLMGVHKPSPTEEVGQLPNPMDFIAPTQFVELPSKGRYPEGHPLHNQDVIEIKYMTAKDEDILTNRSLLKKGLAIDRLIQNVIKDKKIDSKSLYVGDRNAILINARASAYGSDYRTSVQCPKCTETSKFKFDLNDHEVYYADDIPEDEIKNNNDGTFSLVLPFTKLHARIRPLVGQDELNIFKESNSKDLTEDIISRQMKHFIVDINGYSDKTTINHVCENMPATDARLLREALKLITADINMEQMFTCKHCGHEEVVVVPFGTDFFWPDR